MDVLSAEHHLIRDEDSLNALYGEIPAGALAKEIDYIHPHYRAMIEASPPGTLTFPQKVIRRALCMWWMRRRC